MCLKTNKKKVSFESRMVYKVYHVNIDRKFSGEWHETIYEFGKFYQAENIEVNRFSDYGMDYKPGFHGYKEIPIDFGYRFIVVKCRLSGVYIEGIDDFHQEVFVGKQIELLEIVELGDSLKLIEDIYDYLEIDKKYFSKKLRNWLRII